MFWQSIKLGKTFSCTEIAEAIGSVFNVDKRLIVIGTRSWDFEAQIDTNTLIICTIMPRLGDFPTDIEIILDDVLDKLIPDAGIVREVEICKKLGCKGLIGDFNDNPYHWILISEEGSYQRVVVDSNLLDQEEPGFKIESFID